MLKELPSNPNVSQCDKDKNHLKFNDKCPHCMLSEKYQSIIYHSTLSKVNKSTSSKKIGTKNVGSVHIVKSQNNPIQSFQSQNYNSPQGSNYTKSKRSLNHYVKLKLLRKVFIWSLIIHFGLSTYLFTDGYYSLFLNDYFFINYIKSKLDTHLTSTLVYLGILSALLYIMLRGRPARDCPNCGAYAGSLKFMHDQKDYVGYRHETKKRLPDLRYKDNPKLYQLFTTWFCRYCKVNVVFTHEISPKPKRSTVIVYKNWTSS